MRDSFVLREDAKVDVDGRDALKRDLKTHAGVR